MQFNFSNSGLSEPTVETFINYSTAKFNKLARFYPKKKDSLPSVSISIKKERHDFHINVESLYRGKILVIKEKDKDLRAVIDKAQSSLKLMICDYKKRKEEHNVTWKEEQQNIF